MLCAGCAALTLMLNSLIGETGYLARRIQQQRIEVLTKEIDRINQDTQRLTHRIQDLKNDPRTIEELARERLRLGRANDVVVALPDSTASPR